MATYQNKGARASALDWLPQELWPQVDLPPHSPPQQQQQHQEQAGREIEGHEVQPAKRVKRAKQLVEEDLDWDAAEVDAEDEEEEKEERDRVEAAAAEEARRKHDGAHHGQHARQQQRDKASKRERWPLGRAGRGNGTEEQGPAASHLFPVKTRDKEGEEGTPLVKWLDPTLPAAVDDTARLLLAVAEAAAKLTGAVPNADADVVGGSSPPAPEAAGEAAAGRKEEGSLSSHAASALGLHGQAAEGACDLGPSTAKAPPSADQQHGAGEDGGAEHLVHESITQALDSMPEASALSQEQRAMLIARATAKVLQGHGGAVSAKALVHGRAKIGRLVEGYVKYYVTKKG